MRGTANLRRVCLFDGGPGPPAVDRTLAPYVIVRTTTPW